MAFLLFDYHFYRKHLNLHFTVKLSNTDFSFLLPYLHEIELCGKAHSGLLCLSMPFPLPSFRVCNKCGKNV